VAPENKSSAFWICCRYETSQTAQIIVGLTSGALTVLYSPQTSLNGAKLLLNKGPAKRPTIEDMSDAVAAPAIIIPGVTRDGEFTSGLPNKRKRDKDRQDPRKSRRPELPVHGPGRGGRVGASATQHVVQNLVRDTTRDEDVRIILVSIFASAFCVALGNPGVLVPQEIAWFGLSVGCPSTGKCALVQSVSVYNSGERVQKVPKGGGGGGASRSRASGHVARRNFQGNRRGDGTSERHAASE
jgi:hypothetical protein